MGKKERGREWWFFVWKGWADLGINWEWGDVSTVKTVNK
jgi:hypothetical protein